MHFLVLVLGEPAVDQLCSGTRPSDEIDRSINCDVGISRAHADRDTFAGTNSAMFIASVVLPMPGRPAR